MNLVKVKCAFCGKEYFRQAGRVNEAKKFGWNQYCSKECQNKARTTRVEKVCGNSDCNNKVSRVLNEFKRSKSGLVFCSQSCAAIVNNRKNPKRRPKFKTCIRCGKQFRKSKGNLKFCSAKCQQEARQKYTPQNLIKIIKRTAQKLKRIPAKRELEGINKACIKYFGSWNNAVLAAGFTPNRSHDNRMYKRSNAKAFDGHLCDSVSELLIDNWLHQNNIPHERDAHYPGTHHKADWEIISKNQKIFVEYFGLANDSPRYDRAIKEKKKLCRKHKIKLIEIYHWDLYPERQFEKKIKNKLKSLSNIFASQAGGTCTLALHSPSVAP